MGVLGWKEDDFWNSTFQAVFAAIDGYYDHLEIREKESWRQAQFIAWHTIMPHIEKKHIDKVRNQIFFFEEDEKPRPKPLTKEQVKQMFGKWDESHKVKFEKQ